VLGGVAGHAGLFATAGELATIARSLLGHGPQLLAPETVAMLWDTQHRVEGGTYTLGWDTPSGPRSNAGQALRPDSTIGHLGFTGTSLWIERERELVVSLVTNRVHPTRDNAGIRALRPALHDAIVRTLT
jgi:CubicO group peptidase (beta-lactamase class C family)